MSFFKKFKNTVGDVLSIGGNLGFIPGGNLLGGALTKKRDEKKMKESLELEAQRSEDPRKIPPFAKGTLDNPFRARSAVSSFTSSIDDVSIDLDPNETDSFTDKITDFNKYPTYVVGFWGGLAGVLVSVLYFFSPSKTKF